MFEQRLRDFFNGVGPSLHAQHVHEDLGGNLPLIRRYPHIAVAEIHRFRFYLIEAPVDNVSPALRTLYLIVREVPELRDQVIADLGDVLYELKELTDTPDPVSLDNLLNVLDLPVSDRDRYLKDLARSMVSLQQSGVLLIGAGFSYDTMPVTKELEPLMIPLLRNAGVERPVELLAEDDRRAWAIVKDQEGEFKRIFAGWCARSSPSPQHIIACELLCERRISHFISFNWDNLCERAYELRFGEAINKVTAEGLIPDQPALWKLHGDVDNPQENWIFPYEPGRVFNSLLESLEGAVRTGPPAFALIVGYSEWEQIIRERLIRWLQDNVPMVLRVRPNWPQEDTSGIPDSARRFLQRLGVYIEIEERRT